MRAASRSTIVGIDTLAAALFLLTAAIFRIGGFVFEIAGTRVSLRSEHRSLLALVMVVVVRLLIAPRAGPFGLLSRPWQRLLDTMQREPLVAPTTPGRWRRVAAAALGIGVALAVLMHDQLAHLDEVADLGDPLFSIWRVSWVLHQLAADPWHLFDANIFYPEHLTLTLSDPVILPALTIAPLLALGIQPLISYNLLLLSAFWMSGVATYVLAERLTGSARAAFVAGLVYACYSYRFEHYSHLELQMTQWMPLALLALHLFLSTRRWPYAMGLAAAGLAQLYSAMYYAVFLLIYAASIAMGLVMVHKIELRRLVRPLAVAALLAAVIAWPLVRAFIAAEPMKGARSSAEVNFYSAFPSDYLRANTNSALWSQRLGAPAPERSLFPGVAPLALAALSFAPPLGTTRLVYAAALLVSVDGTFGLHGALYPLYYQLFAPVRGLRSPARFAALVGLALAILAAFGARRLLQRPQSRTHQRAIFAALIAFVLLDAWPSLPLVAVWKSPPPIYEFVRTVPNPVLVEIPLPDTEIGNIPYMYFSTWHWIPMVNGYSGFIPDSYAVFEKAMRHFPDPTSIEALRRRDVTHVAVNCGFGYAACDELKDALHHTSTLRLIVDTTWIDHPVQLYEVLPR